ncbi:MAG: AmmeMemoRadiSam system protein B [Deltaproteobacteria bacterium RIFOXYD12_FULL_50_9]|nr:MAG: AmmeMemoRadiSam system protein B [Deltaproteobacteria bacterium RIFOXYD12_FULL_50_9]
MIRLPAVANQFYPGDAHLLKETLDKLIPPFSDDLRKKALAIISPHAGYIYSGSVAGETFARIQVSRDVIILGPNHHGLGAPIAIMQEGAWQMPLGAVPINSSLAELIINHNPAIRVDEKAHLHEHSLEVQVSFLQYFQQNLAIVPITFSQLSFTLCEEIGKGIAAAIKDYRKDVLMIASSDMTHYESRREATAKDRQAIEKVLALDPLGLYQTVFSRGITMCGVIPATVALIAAKELGATQAELVRYTDSGEISGDTRQVVGYAGLIIT